MTYKYISFGGGQCSSVLPFVVKDYDLIIFANTGFESEFTYAWVKFYQEIFGKKFIWLDTNPTKKEFPSHPPICTKTYKVEPIRRYLRSLGIKECIKYLGMTSEETNRMRENSVKWEKHEYPLVKLGFTRKKCQMFLLNKFGFIPPRSGCTICKYNKQNVENFLHVKNEKSLLAFNGV